MLKVVPQHFFKNSDEFEHLYHDFESCILYKSLDSSNLKNEYYVSSHVLTIVLKGTKVIQSADSEPITVKENEMIFIPKDLYMIQDIVASHGVFESWLFFFSDDVINNFIKQIRREQANQFKILKEEEVRLPVFKYLEPLKVVTKGILELLPMLGKDANQIVASKLTEILHLMSLGNQGIDFLELIYSLKKGRRNIRDFMEANYDKPLRVEDYAFLTGRSLASFLRDFKTHFNTTPKQWLISRRMKKAGQQLRDTEVNVTQVAFDSGYDNISHFIKAFKKEFDISPKQYALKHQRS